MRIPIAHRKSRLRESGAVRDQVGAQRRLIGAAQRGASPMVASTRKFAVARSARTAPEMVKCVSGSIADGLH